ncbi:virB8 family protein [Cupriavidus necator]
MTGGQTAATVGGPAPRPALPTADAFAKWYLDEARRFEISRLDQQKHLTRLALWAAGAGVVIGLAGILGATALVMVKRPNPPAVLRVSEATGKVDVLGVVTDGKVAFGEKADRADLRRYVEMRESYDWETIQSLFDAVKIMSADGERERYMAFYSQPNAPQKVLKNEVRVVARVGVITFVGTTAQVFFSREVIPLSGAASRKTEYWVATIAYEHDKVPERGSELEINPTAFRVTSYTVDRDWSRLGEAGTAPTTAQSNTVAIPVSPTRVPIQPPAAAEPQPLVLATPGGAQ